MTAPGPADDHSPACSVALAYECDTADAVSARDYLLRLCDLADEHEVRLQFFVPGNAPGALGGLLGGHDVDLLHPALVLPDPDLADLAGDIADAERDFASAVGRELVGVRAQVMARNGLQKQPELQEMLLRLGFGFVSSDYSTRHRAHEHDKAADDNAVRSMKHQQARRYPGGLWEIPAVGYSDTDFLDALGGALEEWTAHLRACLDFAYSLGGLVYAPRLSLGCQVRHDPELRAIRQLLKYAASLHEPVAFLTYRDTHRLAAA